jgi:type IV secretion system protein VirB8
MAAAAGYFNHRTTAGMIGIRRMTPRPAKPLPEALKSAKHRQTLDLVAESALLGRSAIIAGWCVGGLGAAMFAASIYGWTSALPLKTIELRVLTVDRQTGIISQPVGLADAPKLFDTATDEHYLWQYLRARRGWVPEDYETDDHIVKIMSSPSEQVKYQQWRDAQLKQISALGNTLHSDVNILRFYPPATLGETREYFVTFILNVYSGSQQVSSQTLTADVTFQWHPELPMAPADRLLNPGGMVVINYDDGPGMAHRERR